MENNSLTDIAFLIVFVGLVGVVGAALFETYASSVVVTDTISNTTNYTIDYNSAQTLIAPATSSSVTARNRTWLEFDGVDDKIDIGTTQQSVRSNHSYSIWYNLSTECETQKSLITLSSFGLRVGNGNLSLVWRNSTLQDHYANATCLNDSLWHSVIATIVAPFSYSWVNITIYSDGILNESNNFSSGYNFVSNIDLGSSSNSFNGSVDEFRWYQYQSGGDGILNATEISEIYLSGRERNSSLPRRGLYAWHSMDENNGGIVYNINDSSTQNGTISGATWNNDGIDITLTENTDYNITDDEFRVANQDYAWSQLTLAYNWLQNQTGNPDFSLAKDAQLGLAEFGNWFDIIVIIGIAALVLTLIFIGFGRKKEGGVAY